MSHGNTLSNKAVNDLGKRLLEAARHGNTEEVNNLMRSGAPLTTDWLGTTPLHLAAIYGHTSTAEALIKSGISRDGRTKVDKAPLHFACQHGHLEIVKLLVTGGAHVNAADMLKMTPLHWAVEANNFDICLLLLNAGVQTGFKNKFDKTPLRIARDKGYHSIVKLLNDEKFQMLQDMDILHHNKLYDRNVNSVKICRTDNFGSVNNTVLKKPKTRRFPMVAGTWTGGEAQNQDRIDMMEQKKLGIFKKRPPPQQQPVDITPFLGSLHLSPTMSHSTKENNKPITDQQRHPSIGGVHGSPLQQLVETIRQSTYLNKTDVNETTSKTKTTPAQVSIPPSTSTTSQLQSKNESLPCVDMTVVSPDALYSGIPVISSLTLKSLPANIHAIPLSITADDLRKEKLLNTTCNLNKSSPSDTSTTASITLSTTKPLSFSSLCSATTTSLTTNALKSPPTLASNHMMASSQNILLKNTLAETLEHTLETPTVTASTSTSASIPKQETNQHKIPFSLPVDLLNQIMNGDITLHTLLSNNNSQDPSNSILATLAGIKTEMGTIPIIPVSGEGGLQLIPIENNATSLSAPGDRDVHRKVGNLATAAKIQAPRPPMLSAVAPYPVVQQAPIRQPRVYVQNHHSAISKYPLYQPFHGVYNVGNGMVAHHQQQPTSAAPVITSAGSARPAVPTPMLVPTGVYLPPGHPGFLQIHRPHTTPYGPVTTPQNFLVPSLYPSYGPGYPGTSSAMVPPAMHSRSHQILVHPSVQSTFLPSHVQPHYVYMEGSAALNQNAMSVSTVIRTPESPQKPDPSM